MTARVGLIIPSSNRMVEQEMVPAFPPGVQAHVTRLRMTGAHHLTTRSVAAAHRGAAGALIDARCDVVAFHCTANSMEGGRPASGRSWRRWRGPARRARPRRSPPLRAFDALGARRVVLVTPYSAQTTEHEAEFLRQAGYDVLFAKGFALAGSDAYCATPGEFWRDRVIEARRGDADAYLVSCANLGFRRDRGPGGAARPPGRHQQPGGALGRANLGGPRLPGAIVRKDPGGGAGALGRKRLVSGFRSSQTLAAPSDANFGIKGTLATL